MNDTAYNNPKTVPSARWKQLEIPYEDGTGVSHLYPALLWGSRDLVLVDCGYPETLPALEKALRRAGVSPEQLTVLLLTHQDDDHMGAAAALKRAYPHLKIAASAAEAPYISGEKKHLRLAQAEEMQATLPEEAQDFGLAFCARLRALEPVAVDEIVHPGQELDWGSGCRIMETPGHTPGHLSLFLPHADLCITGDGAVEENGILALANPQFCLDLPQAERSLARLLSLPCHQFQCYHTGLFRR